MFGITPQLQTCKIQYGAIDSGRCGDPSIMMFVAVLVAIIFFIISVANTVNSFRSHNTFHQGIQITLIVINAVLMVFGFMVFLMTVSA